MSLICEMYTFSLECNYWIKMAPFGSNKVEPERLQTSLLSPEIILIISINDEQLKLKKCTKEKNFKIKKNFKLFKKVRKLFKNDKNSDLATRERNNC